MFYDHWPQNKEAEILFRYPYHLVVRFEVKDIMGSEWTPASMETE